MNVGKTLFAQIMEFILWITFWRFAQHHRVDWNLRKLN